ncbi:MAG: adenine deaminase [Methanobacteriaceae archaeon]|nr:adenine deaminase [Methanobacteriaceae archaeon]
MIRGNILNVFTDELYPAEITIKSGIITCVKKIEGHFDGIIIPGLIDAHIHIESSMLTPSFFAKAVVTNGTTAVVADPHEIANVWGLEGINFMLNDSKKVPLRFFFSAPSCVPATEFETSGAVMGSDEIDILMEKEEIVALGEMMNFPGVINADPQVMAKIASAKRHKKPIDGHAPLLSAGELCSYISSGISTDHECSSLEEALEKKELGMKIMIREGSSAKNLEDLISVGGDFLVSDDKHPQDLLEGHLNYIVKKAIKLGMDPVKAIKMVTINSAKHYSLNMGAISPGRAADFILIDNLTDFNVKKVFIGGELVAENKSALFDASHHDQHNSIALEKLEPSDFRIHASGNEAIVRVINVSDGQIISSESEARIQIINRDLVPDTSLDVLKISVIERHGKSIALKNKEGFDDKELLNNKKNRLKNLPNLCTAFVKGFGIEEGAFASSVAHDSHNVIVIGTNNQYMSQAVNTLIENKGGLVAISKNGEKSLKLPIAGLMVDDDAEIVSSKLRELHNLALEMGCSIESPLMTMSFLTLLVIPQLKISDKGLFDVSKFEFVDVIKKIIN